MKGRPLIPDRCWRNSTGPGEVSLISRATSPKMGLLNTSARNDPIESMNCLISLGQEDSGVERKTSTGQP